jgi:environmental stress-induced protein Ves
MLPVHFAIDSLPVSRWRNGGGETREIVSWPQGAAQFDWRASVATIAQDGPFSAFAGIDRSITLIAGDSVRLWGEDGEDFILTTGKPLAFAGELALHATIGHGPSQDFNIMTHRTSLIAQVNSVVQSLTLPIGHSGVVLVIRGEGLLGGDVLREGEGCWWSMLSAPRVLTPQRPDSLILWADIKAR